MALSIRAVSRLATFAVLGCALALTVAMSASAATFVDRYCKRSTVASPTSPVTREQAFQFAYLAAYEGYHWGGGCWNNNDRDDSPGEPKQTESSGGEGPDCSGLVFKAWFEGYTKGDTGWWSWPRLTYQHGPYRSDVFETNYGPNSLIKKGKMIIMDVAGNDHHVALLFTTTSDGSDIFLEAKGEDYGTNTWVETYRANAAFKGGRRVGWAG